MHWNWRQLGNCQTKKATYKCYDRIDGGPVREDLGRRSSVRDVDDMSNDSSSLFAMKRHKNSGRKLVLRAPPIEFK